MKLKLRKFLRHSIRQRNRQISLVNYSEQKDQYKDKLYEVKKDNLRLERRIETAELEVKEMEDELSSGIKLACMIY